MLDDCRRPHYAASSGCVHALLVILCTQIFWLAGCTGQPTAAGAGAAASPALATALTPVVVRVPATVEVTRVVMTERILAATPTPPGPCAPVTLQDAQEIVVAALLPISQPALLANALSVQAGLALAVDSINGAGGIGGKPLRLRVGDTAGNPDQAARAAEQAITVDCALALVTASASDVTHAALAVAHRYGTPLVIVDAPDDDLTASGYPEVFRLAPSNSMLAAAPAAWLDAVGDYNGDGARSAILITEEGEAGAAQAQWLGGELVKRGFQTDTYAVMLPSQDFSSLVARLVMRAVTPDAILIRFSGDSASALQRQLLDNGIGPQKRSLIVAMRNALQDAAFWGAVGDQGTYTVAGRVGPWHTTANEAALAFAQAYAGLWPRWPDASSFAAHDALYLLADAAQRAPSLASADLIAALEQTDLTLASGHITFTFGGVHTPAAAAQPAWAWHQWLEPALLFLQYTQPNQPAAEMAVIWPPPLATVEGAVVRPAQ